VGDKFGDSALNCLAAPQVNQSQLNKQLSALSPNLSPHVGGRVHSQDGIHPEIWKLPEEAPASILYNGQSFAVMMVTPADLEDFAIGFSITEGIAASQAEIGSIRIAEAADGFLVNVEVDAGALQRAEGACACFRDLAGGRGD
jgi:FdhD protein